MIVVNRHRFMAWAGGLLLERDGQGRVLIGDDSAHEMAEKAMEDGKTIGLAANGAIVTHMSLVDGSYEETEAP